MTEVKIPEPSGRMPYPFGYLSRYTDDQMKQYGDDRAREALEMAIEQIAAVQEGWGDVAEECGMSTAITTIRALAKEIK